MATQRQRKKAVAAASAHYDAAGAGRRIASWNPAASGPNRESAGIERLRSRTRDSVRNDWAASSGVQKWTTALIGTGITPRWKDAGANDAWAEFAAECDADEALDAYGLQALGARSWLSGGEAFLRRRPRDLALGLPAPVQFQLLESEFVPRLTTDSYRGMPRSHTLQEGVERNVYGRRIAYWMHYEHPGDLTAARNVKFGELLRVLARDVSHVYAPERPGALRGVSPMANILVRLRSSADFEDAVLDRQKLANLYVGFVKRALPPEWADVDFDPATGLPKFYRGDGQALAGLEPGIMQDLQPGESVEFANPPEAGTTFSDYLRSTHLGTAAGQGLPYELMAGDIREVSDRTLRVVINEFRRFAEQRQWHVIIPRLCRPMVRWWAEARTLVDLSPRKAKELQLACEWFPHGWDYIHPVQDVEGKIKAIDAGLTSRSAEISKRGDDPAAIDAQRAEDQRRADDLGLRPLQPQGAAQPAAPDDDDDDDPLRAVLAQQAMVAEALRALAEAKQPVAPAPPPPHMTAEALAPIVASAVAEAMQHMLPAFNQAHETSRAVLDVLRTMAAQPPAPVNVAAPSVAVTNNVEPTPVEVAVTNNVEPTPVEVHATLTMPDRESTTDVERDPATGELVRSKTIERTIQ